jgi:DNA-binding XRE family transcriptional regulator
MKTTSHEELLNEIIGAKGTDERKAYEQEVKVQVDLYNMGEAIKAARIQRGLSQEQLGALIGVKRSRMCQIEKGIGLTLSTISRSLKALNVHTNIVMEGVGTYSLA